MAYNQFDVKRVAVATFSPTDAGDYASSVVLPSGAVVTGIYITEDVAFADGTSIQLFAGPSATGTALTDAVVTANIATGSIALASSATAIELSANAVLTLEGAGTYSAGTGTIYVEYLAA